MKLSVVLATFNEEKNIAECLRSVKEIVDEIIVFDESSTDKTREIAESLGAKVFKVKHEPLFHITKQKAIDSATGDWILQLDADERVIPALANEIRKVVESPKEKNNGFWIKRKNYFLGHWMKGSGMWPDSTIRLFRRGKGHLPQVSVHEQAQIDGSVGTLENPMEHHTAPTFNKYLVNANRYTTLTALELENKKYPVDVFHLFWWSTAKPLWTFVMLLIRHRGIRDGMYGFVFDLFSGLHFPIAYFKYWQILNNPSVKNKLINWK
ncbi:glycosyltransferase family 2 protein [Patescibacteria group bacterium]|nr:glycosyltransferase family 2 protein [Patescibacteria group bacterium]